MSTINRRDFFKVSAAGAAALSLSACATTSSSKPTARVVVIGGGFGGATAAKYIRHWAPQIEVVLIEPNQNFISCPLSNLVLGGTRQIEDLTTSYDGLVKRGVKLVRDYATKVDPDKKEVHLKNGDAIKYDRLIVSPGIEFLWGGIPGLASEEARNTVLHAWKAGPQTVALRKQLEAIPNGGVYALHIPMAPYRCPPGPYERAAQIAYYFKNHKPKSKVLILDSNPDITSKKGLFLQAWNERYAGIVEYVPNSALIDVDARTRTLKLEFGDDVRADVLNVVPPQRAGNIAQQAGLITANDRWCGVDWRTMESLVVPGIHVLGDATLSAPGMPKSGFMANNHAKIAADAVIALITGREVNQSPIIANTCYSFVSDTDVVHVASVHKYDAEQKTLVAVQGAGGLSAAANPLEGRYADSWAKNIWADALK